MTGSRSYAIVTAEDCQVVMRLLVVLNSCLDHLGVGVWIRITGGKGEIINGSHKDAIAYSFIVWCYTNCNDFSLSTRSGGFSGVQFGKGVCGTLVSTYSVSNVGSWINGDLGLKSNGINLETVIHVDGQCKKGLCKVVFYRRRRLIRRPQSNAKTKTDFTRRLAITATGSVGVNF